MRRSLTPLFLMLTLALTSPAFAQSAYFAGMFAQGCDSVGRCVAEAQTVAQSVCAKLGYGHVATPTRESEILVIAGGGAQGNFTWQAPVNCTNQASDGSKPSG